MDTCLKLREYSPESILSCVIVTLEQFSNFNIIDTHGIVISKWFLYDFVRSYNIYQMHFKPEEKKLTARLVLILLCHRPSC
jgi:hypothetical protein